MAIGPKVPKIGRADPVRCSQVARLHGVTLPGRGEAAATKLRGREAEAGQIIDTAGDRPRQGQAHAGEPTGCERAWVGADDLPAHCGLGAWAGRARRQKCLCPVPSA